MGSWGFILSDNLYVAYENFSHLSQSDIPAFLCWMSKMRSRRVTAWRRPLVWRLTGVTGRSTEVATTWLTLDGAALVNPSYHSLTKVSWILLSNRLCQLSRGNPNKILQNRSIWVIIYENFLQGWTTWETFLSVLLQHTLLSGFFKCAYREVTTYKRHLAPLIFREFRFFFCF